VIEKNEKKRKKERRAELKIRKKKSEGEKLHC